MWIYLLSCFILIQINAKDINESWSFIGNPLLLSRPCKNNQYISLSFEPGLPPDEENVYTLHLSQELPVHTRVEIKFDSPATVTLTDPKKSRIESDGEIFIIVFFADSDGLDLNIKGPPSGTIPYVTSFVVNYVQYCKEPDIGFLDQYLRGYQSSAQVSLSVPDDSCGRRKVVHTELITNGLETKPGDWPWHAALYKLEGRSIKYICGGSLISKTVVLTAAHCVTNKYEPLIPELLSVVLGKHNLIGGDLGSQEIEVHSITVHENFNRSSLNNDIALLKLKSEARLTDYVQPVCLWQNSDLKKIAAPDTIFGTVIGWGFDQTDKLSSQLRQATMPKVSENACIKSNPLFYGRLLNENKFCAGFRNGTSVCNGDSGGGYLVFVPDIPGDTSAAASGTWHIRGITSLAFSRRNIALCDSQQYVIFTDVEKYGSWLNGKI